MRIINNNHEKINWEKLKNRIRCETYRSNIVPYETWFNLPPNRKKPYVNHTTTTIRPQTDREWQETLAIVVVLFSLIGIKAHRGKHEYLRNEYRKKMTIRPFWIITVNVASATYYCINSHRHGHTRGQIKGRAQSLHHMRGSLWIVF